MAGGRIKKDVWAWMLDMALLVGVEANRGLEVRRAGRDAPEGPASV